MSEKQPGKKPFIDGVVDFFCSVKLSIFVLLALAVTSIIGTVVEQGEEAAHYLQHYGSTWGAVINAFNFGDMYHAWWFQVLIALLMVNITFCSLRRMPAAIRQMKDRDPLYDKRDRPVAIHDRKTLTAAGQTPEAAMEKVAAIIGAKTHGAIRGEADGALYALGTRGGWARMGVYVTHFSLFLFALGAIVGLATGFKGYVNIKEGETAKEVYDRQTKAMAPLDFNVRCDKFEVTYYPNSMRVKSYASDLTVIEGGREVLTKHITVNDPLIHNGYYFYQSSYGKAGLNGVTISVAGPDRNILTTGGNLINGKPMRLPDGSDITIRDIREDREDQGAPAGIVFGISRMGAPAGTGLAYEAAYGRGWYPVGPYQVRLEKIDWHEYTGLQVARDPGVPIVWAGCILITLGLLVSFFISHRRVWVKVVKGERGAEITVVGNASRNRIAFEGWFGELCEEIQEAFEKKRG